MRVDEGAKRGKYRRNARDVFSKPTGRVVARVFDRACIVDVTVADPNKAVPLHVSVSVIAVDVRARLITLLQIHYGVLLWFRNIRRNTGLLVCQKTRAVGAATVASLADSSSPVSS
jgi:hypothetical protein